MSRLLTWVRARWARLTARRYTEQEKVEIRFRARGRL